MKKDNEPEKSTCDWYSRFRIFSRQIIPEMFDMKMKLKRYKSFSGTQQRSFTELSVEDSSQMPQMPRIPNEILVPIIGTIMLTLNRLLQHFGIN